MVSRPAKRGAGGAVPPPVRRKVHVPVAPEVAFRRFTAEMSAWWPLGTHSLGQAEAEAVDFEPRQGGRIIERIRGGREAVWGTVTAWDPPRRVAFTWHPGRDPETAQDVVVSFAADGAGTRVELEHAGWERYGEGMAKARRGYGLGWWFVLELFAGRRGLAVRWIEGLTEWTLARRRRRAARRADGPDASGAGGD